MRQYDTIWDRGAYRLGQDFSSLGYKTAKGQSNMQVSYI